MCVRATDIRHVLMTIRSSMRILAFVLVAAGAAVAEPAHGLPQCRPVGGTVSTNFIAPTRTLGTATGDLAGAVSADLLGEPTPGPTGLQFNVQHHWVTDNGDTLDLAPALATTIPLPGTPLFAILSYPVEIAGGTGRFAGVYGVVENIGEVLLDLSDFRSGRTVFRYVGTICTKTPFK